MNNIDLDHCAHCGEPCDIFAGDPAQWPKIYHAGCVANPVSGIVEEAADTENNNVKTCPFCDTSNIGLWRDESLFQRMCCNDECKIQPSTPVCDSLEEANAVWNTRSDKINILIDALRSIIDCESGTIARKIAAVTLKEFEERKDD